MSTLVPQQTSRDVRSGLTGEYLRVRKATEALVSHLSPEDLMVQSMPECSPAKWHLAHTTWFFETFLLSEIRGYRAFDVRYRSVFNSYYKGLGDHPYRGDRGTFSRPSLEEVYAYRAHVDAQIAEFLGNDVPAEANALVELGLNHEQQHQELIVTDIKHAFFSQPLRPSYVDRESLSGESGVRGFRFEAFEGGCVRIGHDGSGFAFDNELPRHEVLLRPYSLATRLTTNGEFIAFIDDGGYSRPELWLSDGWDVVQRLGWKAPLYWEREGTSWTAFTVTGQRAVDAREPVCHVSYYEADAFARWSGARLATEFEWENAAAQCTTDGNFAESGLFHPSASFGGKALDQMFGDVWEWTSSPYVGYPGFKPAPGAVGEYNGKFMCNQFVLRGGSCATPRSHIRASYRNFFPPQARWQFMGIRLAKDEF